MKETISTPAKPRKKINKKALMAKYGITESRCHGKRVFYAPANTPRKIIDQITKL